VRPLHFEVKRGPKTTSVLLHEVEYIRLRPEGEEEAELVEEGLVTTIRIPAEDLPELIAWFTKEWNLHEANHSFVRCPVGCKAWHGVAYAEELCHFVYKEGLTCAAELQFHNEVMSSNTRPHILEHLKKQGK
jgi:hypothetical protein